MKRLVLFAMVFMLAARALAQPCADLPQERMASDRKGGCLVLMPVDTQSERPQTLVVVLHGDGRGQLLDRQIERWRLTSQALGAANRNVVFMVRPGYQSPIGNSSGWANPRDDDYTAGNVERVAGALQTLRERYQPTRLILIGHSGGAALSALVLGKYPGTADAALLLACPCDLPQVRAHRDAQRGQSTGGWPNSLNPLDVIGGIPAGTQVWAITGAQDDNTLPMFAKRWVDAAAAKGIAAKFEEVQGQNHGSLQSWTGMADRLNNLVVAVQ